ncbi:MAG: hypothetical protein LH645_10735 [Actinomycetia bacterium]|nr:hypothetical protein [Actinomycetes bacterium]
MSGGATTETVAADGDQDGSSGRRAVAAICVALAMALTTPAALAYWGQRTLNDTQRYLDTVGPLVDSTEVQDAIATTVTNAIQKQVDVEALLNDAFAGVIKDRPRLQLLVGPLAGAVNGLVEREVNDFVSSDSPRTGQAGPTPGQRSRSQPTLKGRSAFSSRWKRTSCRSLTRRRI